MKLAPQGQATFYLAVNTIANSIAAGIAPMLGGKFTDFFVNRQLDWALNYKGPHGRIQSAHFKFAAVGFFFAIAFIIGLYSIRRLSLIKEVGEVEGKVVFNGLITEVRSQVRKLSSVEGLRQMVNFSFTVDRNLTIKVKAYILTFALFGLLNWEIISV